MSREVFPFGEDLVRIKEFLEGTGGGGMEHDRIIATEKQLHVDGVVSAWFDTAGALTAILPLSAAVWSSSRVVDAVCSLLGMPNEHIHYEIEGSGAPRYFMGDQPIEPGAPFVLAGPMTVAAYRASLKQGG